MEVFCPNYAVEHPGLLLAFNVAIADMAQLKQQIAALAQDLSDGSANRSKAHESDLARGNAIPWGGAGIGVQ